ncbi:NADP(H)-dependent aldo-keto reductase [Bacterioplanes sanyensis]|uniref:Protein tas n=1 Tax=Bacterioplanes sanyensis TaxID=1249553 RepID=A0A222FLX7_9GAMM|nr:NADP(H)-dependent aldo-keto reductase [Bacterioplanes sanyensis]ASP39672.1 NADP(H)-dependent aldo-keto reductase [Bacterioplanes sanyensis]
MERRRLGNTDLQVSKLCLGTMTWGEQNSEQQAHEQMDFAIEQGINFFDTAEMYPVPPKAETQGLTEQYIGSWLVARGQRERVILATKVAGPGEWLNYLRGGPKLTREHIHAAVDDSLRRLQTDYIDLYQLHWPARNTNFFGQLGYTVDVNEQLTPLEESLEALHELQQQGKIRHYGLSNESAWGTMKALSIAEARGYARAVSVQNPYNLLNRSYEVGMAEVSHREQVGLLAYSPLAFGALSGKYLGGQRPQGARLSLFDRFQRYLGEQAEEAIARYVAVAQEHQLSPAMMALAFVTEQPFVTSNIIGATNLEQLAENIRSADLQLSDEALSAIEQVHLLNTNPCP